MTEVNPLLNKTSAGQIAQKLDAADGTKDGKINASIWNEFAQEHGGKTINESIDVESAMNSITTYAIREAKKADKNINDLAQEWFNQDYTSDSTKSGTVKDTKETNTTNDADKTNNTKANTATEKSQVQVDYNSIKVNIWTKDTSYINNAVKEAKQIVVELKALEQSDKDARSGKPGARLLNNAQGKEKLINILKRINKNNVAYVANQFPQLPDMIDGINIWGNGLDKNDVYKYVLKHLVNKAKELGLPTKYHGECIKMSLDEMKQTIKDLKTKIINHNNTVVRNARAFNKELPKIRQTFNNANKFLVEVANMNPKPEIKSRHNEEGDYAWKQTTLPDGRWIEVRYDKEGEIKEILISYDTTPDKETNGSTFDGAEVRYTKNKAWYDTDKNNAAWEGSITSGYDFEKLKAIAEKIFG